MEGNEDKTQDGWSYALVLPGAWKLNLQTRPDFVVDSFVVATAGYGVIVVLGFRLQYCPCVLSFVLFRSSCFEEKGRTIRLRPFRFESDIRFVPSGDTVRFGSIRFDSVRFGSVRFDDIHFPFQFLF